jgi:8-oxo-dGTP pyrophosphatase MutT (NUDIX family)
MLEANAFDPSTSTAIYVSGPLVIVEQAGALCLRDNGVVREVLLISSLNTGRWGIPKGHIEPGEPIWTTAEREAYEEAGVLGTARKASIGGYFYRKSTGDQTFCVRVHCVDVHDYSAEYPEQNLRTVRWVPLQVAASAVTRRGLRRLLQDIIDGS